MRAGVAISPDTPASAITDEIGNAADMLLVMTVYPGSSRVQISSKLESHFWQVAGGKSFSNVVFPRLLNFVAVFQRRILKLMVE